VPDGATGNVKCPKCNTIFPAAAPAPMFEVVDDEPVKPAAPPAKKAAPADDDDFDAKPKKKKSDDYDDDDDDRPRKKNRRDDDDNDRPRNKRRRDDDDDDEDDRPRKKKRRRDDYDDEDDDYYRPAKKGNGYANAKVGALLISIGMWLYMGMFGLFALFGLIAIATMPPTGLFAVGGMAGVGATILFCVGLSFCIAGPAKARGMAIATVSVAGAHAILIVITYTNITGGLGRGFRPMGGAGPFEWVILGTAIWVLDLIIPFLIYGGGTGAGAVPGEAIIVILAGACELARMIMVCMTLQRLALAARDDDAAERSGRAMMATCIIAGCVAGGVALLTVILEATKSINALRYLGGLGLVAACVAYAMMGLMGAFAAMATKDTMARRARRG
jgi:hypothetical protein